MGPPEAKKKKKTKNFPFQFPLILHLMFHPFLTQSNAVADDKANRKTHNRTRGEKLV